MKSVYTGIITKDAMISELENRGISNPVEILEQAIKTKKSIYIPELKATLHWIYNGSKQWLFQGGNSNNVADYKYELLPERR